MTGQCLVDQDCFNDGELNPLEPCLECNFAVAPDAWTPVATTTACRPAVDACDVTEFCSASGTCPVDAFAMVGSACTDGDLCTGVDLCDGMGVCLPGTSCDPGVTVTGLVVDLPRIDLIIGMSVDVRASITRSDGSTLDVTDLATWSTSAAARATVSGGVINAVSVGNATITATAGTFTATTSVRVVAAPSTAVAIAPVLAGVLGHGTAVASGPEPLIGVVSSSMTTAVASGPEPIVGVVSATMTTAVATPPVNVTHR